MLQVRKFVPLIHIAGWTLFFMMILVFVSHGPGGGDSLSPLFSFAFFVFAFTYLTLFYVNKLLLVPRLYLNKHQLIYFIIILLALVGVNYLRPFDHLMIAGDIARHSPADLDDGPNGEEGFRPLIDIVSIVVFIMTWSFSSVLCILKQWRMAIERAAMAEADKANAELSFLKAQINPHFLFNTLNNIYALTVSKSERAPDAVMRMSNIMRYVTDDATADFVDLDDEINCIKDYIDLQRLRISNKADVRFTVTGNTSDRKIAPLILMTFVENVFKYGISSHESSAISIEITIHNSQIVFCCRNTIFNNQPARERTGIGIDNTRKRLEYIYKDRYTLNIEQENNTFVVELKIDTESS